MQPKVGLVAEEVLRSWGVTNALERWTNLELA